MRWGIVFVIAGLAGCLRDSLVECGDGTICPTGTICDTERMTCVDPAGISIPEGAIDFASVPCGGMAAIDLPLRNYGVSPIEFSATTTITGVTVSPPAGSIEPGGDLILTITATPGSQSIPGMAVEGTLVVSTDYELVERPLTMTSIGALVTSDGTVDFGDAGMGAVVSRALTVRNAGNAPTELTLVLPPGPFDASVPNPIRLDQNSERSLDLRFAPSLIAGYGGAATLAFSGDQCQPPPPSVQISGNCVGDPILFGNTVIDFGTTMCGVAVATRSLSITNNAGTPAFQTMMFSSNGLHVASYKIPPTVDVPSGATTTVAVERIAIDTTTLVGAKTAMLQIDVTPEPVTKMIELRHNVVAPVLSLSTSLVTFSLARNTTQTMSVMLVNSGNAPANVNVIAPGMAGDIRIAVSPFVVQIPAQMQAPITITATAGPLPTPLAAVPITFLSPGQCSQTPMLQVRVSSM